VKQFLGVPYSSVQPNLSRHLFQVKKNDNNENCLLLLSDAEGERSFTPEALSAMILKRTADFIRDDLRDIVISVPASFNNQQVKALLDAAKISGFNVLCVVYEITAAALLYSVKRPIEEEEEQRIVVIIDIGQTNMDAGLFKLEKGKLTVQFVHFLCRFLNYFRF